MPEAQLTEPLSRGRKRGVKELFAALDAAVKADVDAFLRRGDGECPGLRDPLADRSPSSPRHGEPSRQGDWRAAFVAALAAEIDALIRPRRSAAQDFEALEQALRRQALGLAAQAMAEYYDADYSDHSSSTVACACGQTAHYAGRRPKTFTTLLGPLTLHRAPTTTAPPAAGKLSARPGPGSARHLAVARHGAAGGTGGDERQLRRSERVDGGAGRRGGRPQTGRAHRRSAGPRGRGRRTREGRARTRRGIDDVPGAGRHRRAGAQVRGGRPARQAARRLGQDPRGQARHRVDGGNTQRRRPPERDPGSVSYSAAVESAASRPTDPLPSAFAQRAYREARRRGFDTAARRVIIGDGAEWIWNLAAEQFPGAIEIVDIYHAKGHLCDVAKAIYGAGTDLAAQWGKDRRDELDAGRFDAILTALRAHRETCEEARKCIDYLTRNRHRMRYPEFRAWGLCVSSGRRRGRMQARSRRPAQARRHALDRGRRQRHHRPAVLQAQRPLRGFLGRTSRQGRLTVISRI